MKIGILTFHRGPNYGGFLQAWHLREAVRSLGHKATVINYQSRKHYDAERIRVPKLRPGPLKGFILHAMKSRAFSRPVSDLSDHPFTTNPGDIDWTSYDAVVVGADIVWDFKNPLFGHDPVFFGSLPCQREGRFVAYAPSCGSSDVDSDIPDHVREGIRRFDRIQVRDQATARMIALVTERHPPLVVDPTWLQADPVHPYSKKPDRPFALVYGHGVTPERSKILKKYCESQNLALVACTFPCRDADQRIFSIDPFEWVDLFRNAECVITSTFHGLLYAIKYRKPLLFMPNSASQSKSQLAIDRCGLRDRLVTEGIPFDLNFLERALAPDNGTQIPSQWVEESKQLLKESLLCRKDKREESGGISG